MRQIRTSRQFCSQGWSKFYQKEAATRKTSPSLIFSQIFAYKCIDISFKQTSSYSKRGKLRSVYTWPIPWSHGAFHTDIKNLMFYKRIIMKKSWPTDLSNLLLVFPNLMIVGNRRQQSLRWLIRRTILTESPDISTF